MCIIIAGQSANLKQVVLDTKGLLKSVVDSNPDGVGLMFTGDDGTAVVQKLLSDKEDVVADWLKAMLPDDDRQVAVHARYTTHGNTVLDNTHPYEADGGWLMHNGVLACGNHSDPTKSDTWHYCRTFLDGAMHGIVAAPQGLALLGDHIGKGNRFVIMDKTGRMHIVNKHTGVEYEGLWFANTYAWDVSTLDPTFKSWTSYYRGGDPRKASSTTTYGKGSWVPTSRMAARAYDDYDSLEDYLDARYSDELPVVADDYRDADGSLAYLLAENEDYLAEALDEVGVVELIDALMQEVGTPALTSYVVSQIAAEDDDAFTDTCRHIVAGRTAELRSIERDGGQMVIAEALLYGLDWPDAYAGYAAEDEDWPETAPETPEDETALA